MRSLLIFTTLLALFAIVHCRKIEKKENFVIIVKDKDDQNTTSTDNKTLEPTEKNEIAPRHKSRRIDTRKKPVINNNNVTDPKVMYKFEAKDGRMKFQREVAESKIPESQTESYQPINYVPEDNEPKETPNYPQYQYPLMYYKLCPVPYPAYYPVNQAPQQGYPVTDQSTVYQVQHQENIYRNPKQLVQYAPASDSFTRQAPSNYESGQSYQYFDQGTLGNYGPQLFSQTTHNQDSIQSGINAQQNIFEYSNGQQNYAANPVADDNKFNNVYYNDYMNGIDSHQTNLNQAQQSYVYIPNYENQNSQYSTNYNADNGGSSQNNIYSTLYGGHSVEFGNGYGALPNVEGSFVDPLTGSYQITVGNKYADTTSNSNHALGANSNYYNQNNVVNYQETANQFITPQTTYQTSAAVSNINYPQNQNNQVHQNEGNNYVYNNENGRIIYYSNNNDNELDSINSAFESLKLNAVNQQQAIKNTK